MNCAKFELVSATPGATLPISVTQSTPLAASLAKLVVLVPITGALLVPFALLGHHLIDDPVARQMLLDRPATLAQLAAGLVLWALLFAMPVSRLCNRLARRRRIEVTPTAVHVTERTLAGSTQWSEPLSHYQGVAHHVRASLSGLRHELILVHARRDRWVLIQAADNMTVDDVRQASQLLGVPEISPRELYRLTTVRPEWRETGPLTAANA